MKTAVQKQATDLDASTKEYLVKVCIDPQAAALHVLEVGTFLKEASEAACAQVERGLICPEGSKLTSR